MSLRIAILGQRDGWHVRQLAGAAEARGHCVTIAPFRNLVAHLHSGDATLSLIGLNLLESDRVLVRGVPPGSLEQIVFRMDALHRLRLAGVPVLNPPAAIEACVDKYLATARLQSAGLPVPKTAVCESFDEAMQAFTSLGGDVVVKPLFGSEGRGIFRIDSQALAERVLTTLVRLQEVLYLQEFVPHDYDVRAFVLGGRVLAAMRRVPAGDFRTNISQGGRCESIDLPQSWSQLATASVQAVGALVAGVDLLPDTNGNPMIVEVNSTPGFQALSQTTDVPIPDEIIRFAESMPA